ncbi:MAG: class I SAM-dependent methyltransferase [Planctomycetota bacterium]|jgi:ubiquinone/menaquinone biosynthesis C-methylase UbiE
MFNNFINFDEFLEVAKQIAHGRLPSVLSKVLMPKKKKIEKAWSHTKSEPRNWLDIPAVEQRVNRLISGDEQVDYYQYICDKYLENKQPLTGLSLACGTGLRELVWARSGKFKSIDAYDLSVPRIEYANKTAREKGFAEIINYRVSNAYEVQLSENSYDVVFGEMALHHFTPLKEIFRRINKALKPGGYFIVNEYVGPTRMQWPKRQLEIVNDVLHLLPKKYRIKWDTGFVKDKVFSQSILRMLLGDPSEGIESEKIRPLLQEIFEVAEIKEYGGAILQPLLSNIGHNFLSDDDETQRYLQLCFDAEDTFLNSKEIQSDFIIAVCAKKTAITA